MSYGFLTKNQYGEILIDNKIQTLPVIYVEDVSINISNTIGDCSCVYPVNGNTTGVTYIDKKTGLITPNYLRAVSLTHFHSCDILDSGDSYLLYDSVNVFPSSNYGQNMKFKLIYFCQAKQTTVDEYGLALYDESNNLSFNGSLKQLRYLCRYDNVSVAHATYKRLSLPFTLDNPPVIFIIPTGSTGNEKDFVIRQRVLESTENTYSNIDISAFNRLYSSTSITMNILVFRF